MTLAMPMEHPSFEIEGPEIHSGWTIVAIWRDGTKEGLAGVFVTPVHARRWLFTGAARWLDQRHVLQLKRLAGRNNASELH